MLMKLKFLFSFVYKMLEHIVWLVRHYCQYMIYIICNQNYILVNNVIIVKIFLLHIKMATFPMYKGKLAIIFLLCQIVNDFYFQLENNITLFCKWIILFYFNQNTTNSVNINKINMSIILEIK